MEYAIEAKPSIYNGFVFRSRLEARWAAFFDLIGWHWQYEPFMLDGWIPDFQVFGSDGRFILFEVKPYLNREVMDELKQKIHRAAKITYTNYFTPNCIILNNDFYPDDYNSDLVFAGYQVTSEPELMRVQWKDNQGNSSFFWDIGSDEGAYDGLLWMNQEARDRWTSPNDESLHLLWHKALRATFPYNS